MEQHANQTTTRVATNVSVWQGLVEKTAKVFIDIKMRVYKFVGDTISKVQSISQVSQSVSQSVNQSVSQSVSQSVRQSVSQLISRSISKSVSQSVSRSVSQSVSASFIQSASH